MARPPRVVAQAGGDMNDIESMKAEIESLLVNVTDSATRIRHLEEIIDTRNTPLWKRIVFRLDGWPSWVVVAEAPQWRPWRKWWTS